MTTNPLFTSNKNIKLLTFVSFLLTGLIFLDFSFEESNKKLSQKYYSVHEEDAKFEKFIPTPERRFLVFSTVGKRSSKALRSWLGLNSKQEKQRERNFDLILYYYESDYPAPFECPGDFCFNRRGFKGQNFYHFLTSQELKADDYEAAFMVDDDIIMNLEDINKMFEIFAEYKLKVAAPAFEGETSHMHFPAVQKRQENTIVTFTNFVEISVLVTDFELLVEKMLPVLKRSFSGAAVDFCFLELANPEIHEVATIHAVKSIHPLTTPETVTKASNKYNKTNAALNAKRFRSLMRFCKVSWYDARSFFSVKVGEDRATVLERELPKFLKYKRSFKEGRWQYMKKNVGQLISRIIHIF